MLPFVKSYFFKLRGLLFDTTFKIKLQSGSARNQNRRLIKADESICLRIIVLKYSHYCFRFWLNCIMLSIIIGVSMINSYS